ncbi:MAG TPA: LacI family DNA-binding transcriptional regulator [Naasia sp.]|jgi:LacI family transcriptional regulator
MVNIRDVAVLAGVSAGTVSNVLNRPSYVNAETRRRVLEAMEELRFVPSKTARQFRPGRQRTLGFALADMGNPFFVDVALGAERAAKERGVGVVIVHNGEDVAREEQNLDLLVQQRVHGIMITPVDEQNPRLEQLVERGVPLVYVDRISGDRPCCWLATDDLQGGRLAGEHLLSLGHRRIAFIGAENISRQVSDRHRGLREAATTAGLDVRDIELIPATTWKIGEGRAVGEMLARRRPEDRPTAVFCANDMLALGVLQELVLHGVAVPGDVSVVGFDDLDWAATSVVPLTSVRQPRDLLGRTAVRMLLDEIEQGADHVHEHVSFPPELIVRKSSGPRP